MGTEFDVSLAEGRDRQGCPNRGRPRSEAVEHAIIEGVMKLLEEGVPLADISIERLARTVGVGKATIYRRWSGKDELFVDVMRAAEPQDPELPGVSMRDDLVVLLESLRRRGLVSRSSAILHNVHAQMKSSPKLWAAYDATVIAPDARSATRCCAAARRTANSAPTSTSNSSTTCSSVRCSCGP